MSIIELELILYVTNWILNKLYEIFMRPVWVLKYTLWIYIWSYLILSLKANKHSHSTWKNQDQINYCWVINLNWKNVLYFICLNAWLVLSLSPTVLLYLLFKFLQSNSTSLCKVPSITSEIYHINNLFKSLTQISLLFFVNKMIEYILGLIYLDLDIQNLKLFFEQFCQAWKGAKDTLAWYSRLLFLHIIIVMTASNKGNDFS